MKTAIIYISHTGFTKRYAEWIREELGCDMYTLKEVKSSTIDDYDVIIYGGRVHASFIDGWKKFQGLMANKGKKIVLYATGATPAEAEPVVKMWEANLPGKMINEIPHFYMHSGLCYEKMGFFDRSIMKMMSKMLAKKGDRTSDEQGTLDAVSSSYDNSSKDYVKPLVEYVKGLD